ncbi:CHAD domain-containing protein [Oxynema aestuarii]|uniref:CHAD domain-containing protein n=1 Tax=Oxynema aestuarii AP17 TaxID=2064643 RepID=A0A6H1TWW9_9CYAN|nr:CHAD domain-containing protein [Oxynema aestuarii]QIZ70647.1 CHAD domain-containing protein [Oxynema aestuarii AP17]
MAYRIQEQETIDRGIKRIVGDEIELAIADLRGHTHLAQEEAIHDARKRLKKLRAVARLVRFGIGDEAYRRENQTWRDAGRLLSDVRDASVYVETLDKLKSAYANYIAADAFSTTRSSLVDRRDAILKQHLGEDNKMEQAAAKIEQSRTQVEEWNLGDRDWEAIAPGFQRIYKQGRKALQHAFENRSIENFHDWRKRVKDFWYHLRILESIWPSLMNQMQTEAKQLSDYLGDDHDLAVLRQLLVEYPKLCPDREEFEALIASIDLRRNQLQRSAKVLGDRLYAEKASAFVDRLGHYWYTWKAEQSEAIGDWN